MDASGTRNLFFQSLTATIFTVVGAVATSRVNNTFSRNKVAPSVLTSPHYHLQAQHIVTDGHSTIFNGYNGV